MGYILPMRPLQYDTYHQRVNKKENGPYIIEKPHQVLHHKLNSHEYRSTRYIKPAKLYSETGSKEGINNIPETAARKLVAGLTGKGKHIDKIV
ncbi:hypothetical protein GCM10008986_17790 [Salinibacillus aidingensis]|uniref:Transposase n=1 Tax=Salinibacillus aidingensis TaxID=237684 RepID=A0ABP3L4H2_9BACI